MTKCVYLPGKINAFWLKSELDNFAKANKHALTSIEVVFETDREGVQAMFLKVLK